MTPKKTTVLLLERRELFRDMIADGLAVWAKPSEIIKVASAAEALEVLRGESSPTAAIIDVYLSESGLTTDIGLQFAQQKDTLPIFMTADASVAESIKAAKLPCFRKPFPMDELAYFTEQLFDKPPYYLDAAIRKFKQLDRPRIIEALAPNAFPSPFRRLTGPFKPPGEQPKS